MNKSQWGRCRNVPRPKKEGTMWKRIPTYLPRGPRKSRRAGCTNSSPPRGKWVGTHSHVSNPHQGMVRGLGCTRSCSVGELGGNAFPLILGLHQCEHASPIRAMWAPSSPCQAMRVGSPLCWGSAPLPLSSNARYPGTRNRIRQGRRPPWERSSWSPEWSCESSTSCRRPS